MTPSLLDDVGLARRFTAGHHDLRQAARSYFTTARLQAWRADGPGHLVKAHWQELGRLGFLGVGLPRELGGHGLGLLGAVLISEATSQLGDLGVSLGIHCQSEITAQWLATAHDGAIRDRYLARMIAGRLVGCACDTEPDARSHSSAVRDGDSLLINGRKMYVVNGANADLCFVTVRLDGDLTTVLVEKERSGVSVVKVLDKLGTCAIDSAILAFDRVRVPVGNVAMRRGVRHVLQWTKVMTVARFLMSIDAYFLHARLLERMLDYADGRIVDGRPLARWPISRRLFSHAIADQALMRAGLIDGFERLESGRNAAAEVAALKWFCVERTTRLAARCAEMHGGAGYMWDSPFLNGHAQILGLRMAGGSMTAMKTIAGQAFAVREEMEAAG